MNALVKNKISYFKTELPEQFKINIDQQEGTILQITPELSFKSDYSNKDGIDLALIDWLNYEFSANNRAQYKLREIKALSGTNTGHVAIADYGEMTIVSVDLFHTMCVVSSMGYDIHSNIDIKTKKILSFSLSKIRFVKTEFA